MDLNSFIGKTVISTSTHNRYVIEKITSLYVMVCKVLDALCALCIIEIIEGPPNLRYRRLGY